MKEGQNKLTKADWLVIVVLFIIGFGIRLYPEIKAGYWPIGYYSFNAYLSDIVKFDGNFWRWILSENLLYFLMWPFYKLGADPSWVVKITGSVLYGALAAASFIFSRKYLKWPLLPSVLTGLLVLVQLPALRMSWDLFRNILGLILLLPAIYFLENNHTTKNYILTVIFSLLIVLSNQLAAAVWFVIVLVWIIIKLFKKDFKGGLKIIGAIVPAALLFVLAVKMPLLNDFNGQVIYKGETASRIFHYFVIYKDQMAYKDWASLIGGLFQFNYKFIWPLVLIGLVFLRKKTVLLILAFWLLFGTFSSLIFGGYGLFVWSRWLYMLFLPFTFFAAAALFGAGEIFARLKLYQKNKIFRFTSKSIAAILLAGYLFVFIYTNYPFVATPTVKASAPFLNSKYNEYQPPSMLNNAVGFENLSNILSCIDYVNENAPDEAIIMIDNRYRGIGLLKLDYSKKMLYIYPWSKKIPSKNVKEILDGNYGPIYTIWDSGATPKNFEKVYTSGVTSVYREKSSYVEYKKNFE